MVVVVVVVVIVVGVVVGVVVGGGGVGVGVVVVPARIFVVQEQLNRILGFCTVLYGGLLGYEAVSTGSFDA